MLDANLDDGDLWRVGLHMVDSLRARGPDGAGVHFDAGARVLMVQTQLSIRERHPSLRQPVASPCGRYVVAFNGEIYNTRDLIESCHHTLPPVHRNSDTAVLAATVSVHGVDRTLAAIDGMFAIAIWDDKCQMMCLARDRIGEKPLYWAPLTTGVIFASAPHAMAAHPEFSGRLDESAVRGYVIHGYVAGESSIFEGVHRVAPGSAVKIVRGRRRSVRVRGERYWSATSLLGLRPSTKDSAAAREGHAARVESSIRQAVHERIVADVEVGVALSGGVDSALVTAFSRERVGKLRAFTIKWADAALDESERACQLATWLDVDHTIIDLGDDDLMRLIQTVPGDLPEPLGDSSQIPTAALAEEAKRHVGVLLTGDGGDELFGGYERHQNCRATPPTRGRLPDLGAWRWSETDLPLDEHASVLARESDWPLIDDGADLMMWLDLVSYLPDNNLFKADAVPMRVALEARAPFLARDVMMEAWRIPSTTHVTEHESKRLLKAVMLRSFPLPLIPTVKRGFQGPVWAWLEGPLREWASDLLISREAKSLLPISSKQVQARIERERGRGDGHWLWSLLMLLQWQLTRPRLSTVDRRLGDAGASS